MVFCFINRLYMLHPNRSSMASFAEEPQGMYKRLDLVSVKIWIDVILILFLES